MNGLNKAMIIGTLGKDPEIRYTNDGTGVATLSVATNEKWKDKSGDQQERTEWHRVTLWGRLAEIAGEYLRKGSHVYIEGKIQTRKWQDRDGNDRYTTEIVGRAMQMLGGGPDRDAPRSRAEPREANRESQPPDFLDDDIPF